MGVLPQDAREEGPPAHTLLADLVIEDQGVQVDGLALAHLPVARLGTNRALTFRVPSSGLESLPGGMVSVTGEAYFTVDWGDPSRMPILTTPSTAARASRRPPTSTPEAVAPLALVVPAQVMVEALARSQGLDPDAPRGLSKVTQTDRTA